MISVLTGSHPRSVTQRSPNILLAEYPLLYVFNMVRTYIHPILDAPYCSTHSECQYDSLWCRWGVPLHVGIHVH